MIISSLCLIRSGGVCDDDLSTANDDDENSEIGINFDKSNDDVFGSSDEGHRKSRFVIIGGDGVPEYDEDPVYEYDYNDYWYIYGF